MHGYLYPGKAFELWLWEEIRKAYNVRKNLTRPPSVCDLDRHLCIYATQAGRGLVSFEWRADEAKAAADESGAKEALSATAAAHGRDRVFFLLRPALYILFGAFLYWWFLVRG